jgi:SAGA-associated factor 29
VIAWASNYRETHNHM